MKTPVKPIACVGLVANVEKPSCAVNVRRAAALAARTGRRVLCEDATASLAGLKSVTTCKLTDLARESDLLLVFGGDGTILRIAREVAAWGTPIFGINVGKLGFLTGAPSRRMDLALRQIWTGDFTVETRPMMEAVVQGVGGGMAQLALNDLVISRGAASRMIELEVAVDGEILTRYLCDGLIISSPTGSTAYTLSAGGAIVTPDAEVFALTPICPHTLSNRSVIVSLRSVIQVKVLSLRPATILSADGQVERTLAGGDRLTVRRSRLVIRLVHLSGTSFFKTLRHKLNWSGSNI